MVNPYSVITSTGDSYTNSRKFRKDASNLCEKQELRNSEEVTKLTLNLFFIVWYFRVIRMDQSSRVSDESFHESKNGLLEDFHPPHEDTTCHECRSRRKFQYSLIIPWLVSLILLVSLGVSTIRSKSCVQKGFWRSSEFGKSRILGHLYNV